MLKEADRRKDEFLATLAHELRNPLAPVRNAVQLLRIADPSHPDVRRAYDIIDRQVGQMTRLVDDLLDLSRITRGQIVLQRSQVDLATVVRAAIETSEPAIQRGGHTLTVNLPDTPVMLHADVTRLGQVFSNLLNNAAKYTNPGGHIEVYAVQHDDSVDVSVRDNGIGIPPELLPRVFEMFTQVGPSTDRSRTGLGIGLALVKRLLDLHKGSIVAESAGVGKGSEFRVTLPVFANVAPRAHVTAGRTRAPGGRREARHGRRRQRRQRHHTGLAAGALWLRHVRRARRLHRTGARAGVQARCSCCSTSACPASTATRHAVCCGGSRGAQQVVVIAPDRLGPGRRPSPNARERLRSPSGEARFSRACS